MVLADGRAINIHDVPSGIKMTATSVVQWNHQKQASNRDLLFYPTTPDSSSFGERCSSISLRPSTMVLYVKLVIYHEVTRRRVPAHWAILVTKEEDKNVGVVYHAVGSPFQGYLFNIKERYNLESTKRHYTVIALGQVHDAWGSKLGDIGASVPTPGISPTPLDPFAVSTYSSRFSSQLTLRTELGS